MNFKPVPIFPDLLNSEGPILSIVELSESTNDFKHGLFLRLRTEEGESIIYTRLDQKALVLFLQGMTTIRELFLNSGDGTCIRQIGIEKKFLYFYSKEGLVLDELFEKNSLYTAFSKDMKPEDPLKIIGLVEEYLKKKTFG
jgi:hypothetical protein